MNLCRVGSKAALARTMKTSEERLAESQYLWKVGALALQMEREHSTE